MDTEQNLSSIEENLSKLLNLGIQDVQQLLQSIFGAEVLGAGPEAGLQKVFDRMRAKYGTGRVSTKGDEKLRREDRIKLYDNLLLLSLGGPMGGWEKWDSSADHHCKKKFFSLDRINSDFAEGSVHKYLLDNIHDNDDIMLKYYRNKNGFVESLGNQAFWLVQSMNRYRLHLVSPIIEKLTCWKDSREALSQKDLLNEAKMEFMERVLKPAANLSWKFRARMYWLLARAKTPAICDFVPLLVQEIIAEDHGVLLPDDEDPLFEEKKVEHYGTLRYTSLLAYASAKNDYDLVFSMLQSKKQIRKSVRYDKEREDKWKRALADALWNAAYKGHDQIVQALLEGTELYPSQLHSDKEMLPPLHVAVSRGFSLVVKAFCAESEKQKTINCHERDGRNHQTPLQVAIKSKELEDIKKILLQTPQVQQAMEEAYRKRDLIVNSANAIMVGAALIAGVSFGGWLQPPLGYHTYYQFTEPLPAPPDTYDSYLFVQGRTSIRVFAISNSISFFFAIASMVAGMVTVMAATMDATKEESYIEDTVNSLLLKLRVTTTLFVVSVLLVLIAFASAAFAILPPIQLYQRDMKITIAVGGFFCAVVIGMMWRKTLSMTKKEKIAQFFKTHFLPCTESHGSS